MKFEFESCGSKLKVELFDIDSHPKLVERSKNIAEKFEKKYSRFIPESFLNILNEKKQAPHTPELVSLLGLAKKVSTLTRGYFDITILPFLENSGYGIHAEILEEKYGSKYIEIGEKEVFLKNNVYIDF